VAIRLCSVLSYILFRKAAAFLEIVPLEAFYWLYAALILRCIGTSGFGSRKSPGADRRVL
jgi:hypothetical protein